jgi:hypothetical protein
MQTIVFFSALFFLQEGVDMMQISNLYLIKESPISIHSLSYFKKRQRQD